MRLDASKPIPFQTLPMAKSQNTEKSFYLRWWKLTKATINAWLDDNASRLGAALAYYSAFSIGPLVFLCIAMAGLIFGEEAARGQLYGELRNFLGPEGSKAIEGLVAGASGKAASGTAAAVSILLLVFTATGVVVQLKDALNDIWKVKAKPGRTIAIFVRKYLISVASILGVGFLLMVSLILSTVLAAIGKYFSGFLPLPEWLLQSFNFALSFSIISLLFCFIFRFLPDVKVGWRSVIYGAVGTAFLFNVGKFLIGFYLGKQTFDSTYGAAASLIIVLLWVYYSSQIVFLGAEFTKVHAKAVGEKVIVTKDAIIKEPGASPVSHE